MKKLSTLLVVGLMSIAFVAQGQEKKGSGLWKSIKRGIESSTGLDVSKETLFVYPPNALTKIKMSFDGAIGDKQTGEVVILIKITLNGKVSLGSINLKNVNDGKGYPIEPGTTQPLEEGKGWQSLEMAMPENSSNFAFQPIITRKDMTSVSSIKFMISNFSNDIFEIRDLPITWSDTPAEDIKKLQSPIAANQDSIQQDSIK